jgi:hypothetical protein
MKMFTLYEVENFLADAIAAADEFIDHETGLIPNDWAKFLEDIQIERDVKCLAVARYCKTLDGESEMVRNEEKALARRRHILEGKYDRLKGYLALAVKQGEKLSDANTVISWRKAPPSVEITDAALVPDDLCKIVREPSKAAIKEAIAAGQIVAGAKMAEQKMLIAIK